MHEDNLAGILIDNVLVLKQRVEIIQRDCKLFFAEPLCHIFNQLLIVRFGKIQHGSFCSSVEDFLYILLPFDISARHHGNTDDAVDFFHQVNGLVVLFI